MSSDVIKALGSVYGERADQVARALRTPASWYSIRVNELKAKVGDITEFLSRMGLQVKTYPELPEAIAVRVEGP
ncbi:MAG: hypothetical protein ACE5KO_01985 [Candidatus Bathyarchaeia archaeon]